MEARNHLSELRRARGMAAAELARAAGISRQTIYAMESGDYVPNTVVALRLAAALGVRVEDLFSLKGEAPAPPRELRADLLPVGGGGAVRLCPVEKKLVAVPCSSAVPLFLDDADGVVRRRRVLPLVEESRFDGRVLVAGCDPAVSLLAGLMARQGGFELVPASCSSRKAVDLLRQGRVHVAGSHLRANLALLRRVFPEGGYRVITYAAWEQGLIVALGNPKSIRSAADLARRDVRIVNREKGAGSRDLLDRLLQAAGVPASQVAGYGETAFGHLPAAGQVFARAADCAVGTRAAATYFGLDFVPLETERYDLVVPARFEDLPGVRALLDLLHRAELRRKLEVLAGYDTSHTGKVQC